MYNAFLSIVCLAENGADRHELMTALPVLQIWLAKQFQDYELIVINNQDDSRITEDLARLPETVRPHLHLINLSNRTDRNHAWLAGLDRANGDYTLLLETPVAQRTDLIDRLYIESQEGNDIVYLRAPRRKAKRAGLLYRIFYWILRRYSDLEVDELAHHTRLFSRRALNSLLRLRENLRYFKAVFSLVGYRSVAVESDIPLQSSESFQQRFRTSLLAITSYTSFLRALMGWIFLGSFLFLIIVSSNALLVRFAGFDLTGQTVEAVSGWTYLVLLIAVFFAVTCLNLYLMSIYLSNIYQEIKQRPLYIIESIKRF
ncbi:MAG: hypothetical protein AAF433_04165 [Bacteroidota bacterium]